VTGEPVTSSADSIFVRLWGSNYAADLRERGSCVQFAMKPRRIDIKGGNAIGKDDSVRTIEHSKIA
jgi:hypothetical protein